MIGTEPTLNVYLGQQIIARILLKQDQLHWQYEEEWQKNGFAVSPFLPLHHEIPNLNTQRYLQNLLPEGHALDVLTQFFHLSKSNLFGLVRVLGLDMSGSLMILPATQSLAQEGFFLAISDEELAQRLDNRNDFNLIVWEGKPRLSVAGLQDKINVVLNGEKNLGFGEGTLCSTHILKFERYQLSHLVLNEFITMNLAKRCGLDVASVRLMDFGHHRALLVERFDRHRISSSQVKRRHVIDGCQALNLPPEYKYERIYGSGRDVAHIREGASFEKLFNFAKSCVNPAQTKKKIIDWALFNLLIFNFDAHGKNISFFVGQNGMSLAPFYDLVNIKMYENFDQDMAMGIGEAFASDDVNAYQLADFCESCDLSRTLVARQLKNLIVKLKNALEHHADFNLRNEEENAYFEQYRKMVHQRCEFLMSQVDEIRSIEL